MKQQYLRAFPRDETRLLNLTAVLHVARLSMILDAFLRTLDSNHCRILWAFIYTESEKKRRNNSSYRKNCQRQKTCDEANSPLRRMKQDNNGARGASIF